MSWISGRKERPTTRPPSRSLLASLRSLRVAGGLLGIALATVGLLLPRSEDAVKLAVDGATLAALDEHGDILYSIELESPFAEALEKSLTAVDCLHEGEVVWSTVLEVLEPWRDREFPPRLHGRWQGLLRTREGPVLVVTASNRFFPTQIAFLDPHGGRLLDVHWLPGGLSSLLFADLDGDGSEEIPASGMSNPGPAMGHATMAVITDPFPEQEVFTSDSGLAMSDFSSHAERAFLVSPRPDFANYPLTHMTAAIRSVAIERGSLEVAILFDPRDDGFEPALTGLLKFDLTRDQEHPNDFIEALHQRLEPRLDHRQVERNSSTRALLFPSSVNGNHQKLEQLFTQMPAGVAVWDVEDAFPEPPITPVEPATDVGRAVNAPDWIAPGKHQR